MLPKTISRILMDFLISTSFLFLSIEPALSAPAKSSILEFIPSIIASTKTLPEDKIRYICNENYLCQSCDLMIDNSSMILGVVDVSKHSFGSCSNLVPSPVQQTIFDIHTLADQINEMDPSKNQIWDYWKFIAPAPMAVCSCLVTYKMDVDNPQTLPFSP